MRVLALETSTPRGGIAVLENDTTLAQRTWTREKSHSEFLTATLSDCLAEARVSLHEIDRLAVGKGPGSFTGIRVAINAARTLSYVQRLPIFAFDTMEILAAAVPLGPHPLLIGVLALRNLIYISRFQPTSGGWQRDLGPVSLDLESIESLVTRPHVWVGSAWAEFESVFPIHFKNLIIRTPENDDLPQAVILARMALGSKTPAMVWNELQALYIRSSEAEEKLRERLKNRPGQ